MKPPVGVPDVDDFYVPSYCNKCSKHFLIKEELEMHKKDCDSINIKKIFHEPQIVEIN